MDVGQSLLSLAAAACTGVACSAYSLVFTSAIAARRFNDSPQLLERQRIEKLRDKSLIFRWFEPLVYEWRGLFAADEASSMVRLQRALDSVPDGLPWKASEFKAVNLVAGVIAGTCFGLVGLAAYGVIAGVSVACCVTLIMQMTAEGTPTELLKKSRKDFIRRLPFAVDLLALMMEAGGTFNESLRTLVREEKDHAIGKEFGAVLGQLDLGETQREAVQNLKNRMPDEEDVAEFVFAVIKGQELGTPLAQILRNQADQMRLKRSQRAEKASADAQVKMTGPGFVIMLACMAIISGPFIMNFWQSISDGGSDLFK